MVWFAFNFRLSIIAAIFLAAFFYIELTRKQPFINLRLLARLNFGLASVVNVSLGIGLYGAVYILPLSLAQIQVIIRCKLVK